MSSSSKTSKEKIKILIAEDSPTQAEQLRYLLDKNGYLVTVAENGKIALDLLKELKPALVISDINMPEMNGFELCQHIKSVQQTWGIPVVLLTSLSDVQDAVDSLACGADSFITKPYNKDYLLKLVRRNLTKEPSDVVVRSQMDVRINLAGKSRVISANPDQTVSLLLSTFEAAIQRNDELIDNQEELRSINEHLEELVEERTNALSVEIAEGKRKEAQLQYQATLLENVNDAVVASDALYRLAFWNSAAESLYGWKSEEILGKIGLDITKTEWPAEDAERMRQAIDKKGSWRGEATQVRRDGTRFPVEISSLVLHDENGQISGYISANRDITDRKQAQVALASSEAELRALFSGMTDIVIVYDKEGQYLKIAPTNPGNLIMAPDEMLGKNVHDVLPQEQANKIIKSIHESLELGKVMHIEYSLPIDGKETWFDASVSPLSEDSVIWVAHDITNRKKAELEIRRRLSELEVLYSCSQVLSQALPAQEIGQRIVDILSESLNWHHATIRLTNPISDTLDLLVFHQPNLENELERTLAEDRFRSIIIRPGQGLAGWAVQNGQTIYSPDVVKDPRYIETNKGIRSGMYIPLKVGEKCIGCISIESNKLDAFSETDEWLLTTLALQAASSLENARLFEETERRLRQVQSLHTIDNAINGSMDLRVTLDVVFDEVVHQLGVDAVDVLQFNPTSQTLSFIAGRGFRSEALKHTQLRLGESFAGMAGLQRKLIHLSDLSNMQTNFLKSPGFQSEGFEEYFGVPLIAKGKLVGVLEVFLRSSFQADHEWEEFLQTLSGQVAIAIDNSTLFNDLQRSNFELTNAYDATIEGWSRALDLRDKETEGHSQRVTELTMSLAQNMNVKESELVHIRRGALLHDIGKLGVPDEILRKPGPLTEEEWVVMRKHPQVAFEMLSPIRYLQPALDIPYCHHEKWDGSGYPRGLKEEEIPLIARIFAIVDVYEALISDRPYRKAWTKAKAIEHIKAESGKHFDPQVVDALMRMEAK